MKSPGSGDWREIPPRLGKLSQLETGTRAGSFGVVVRTLSLGRDQSMLGKIAGAIIGEKLAGRNRGVRGALMGAGIAAVARRGFGPLALALGAGWAAKKMWDKRQDRRHPHYPSEASPASRSGT
jgi:hypothetical protein